MADDLIRFLLLYTALADARNTIAEGTGEPGEGRKGTEAQQHRWHRIVERSRSLAKEAKRVHGDRCQACGVRLEEIYGPIAAGYIEAHHLTPFADLQGRPTELDPATDFAVVCANCHRMLHKGPPYTVSELRDMLKDARDG